MKYVSKYVYNRESYNECTNSRDYGDVSEINSYLGNGDDDNSKSIEYKQIKPNRDI